MPNVMKVLRVHIMSNRIGYSYSIIWIFLSLMLSPNLVQAQFRCATNAGTIEILDYVGTAVDVNIPNTIDGLPVTRIGPGAFYQNITVTNVTIPTGVTNIGFYSFRYCTNLVSVTIPATVTSIERAAFQACYSLLSLTIPANLIRIENDAFQNCVNLTTITVDALNPAFFSADGVLFDKNRTILIQYPAGNSRSNYTIPFGVLNIKMASFGRCTTLADVTIPSSVTNIDASAFLGCTSLTRISIPPSVLSIGSSAFQGCTNMTAITVDALNPAYTSLDGVLFNKSKTTLIQYPAANSRWSSYTIPASVTSIEMAAFEKCASLTKVTILGSVTSIKLGTFSECSNLCSVTLPGTVKIIESYSFIGCANLTSITIPPKVTSLGSYAFNSCASLAYVCFASNAPSLGSYVFANSSNVVVYYLPRTTGWGANYGGRPTFLWNPKIMNDFNFGVRENCFGFTVSGSSNLTVIIESCTNLAMPDWSPRGTNVLAVGSSYFSDTHWSNIPVRFYRIHSPYSR